MIEKLHGEVVIIEVKVGVSALFDDSFTEKDIDEMKVSIIHQGDVLDGFPKIMKTHDSGDGRYYYRWDTETDSLGAGDYTIKYKAEYGEDTAKAKDIVRLIEDGGF